MGGQWLARGVRVLLLVEGGVVICDLIHVSQGWVGRSDGRVSVPHQILQGS